MTFRRENSFDVSFGKGGILLILKAIGCFAIFVLAVFSYFREQSYKLDSLSLQNVEALAEGEEYTHISCIGVGSLDCPVNHSGVKYIFKGY